MADLTIVRAEIPVIDGCPVLGRFNAFVVDQGVKATLEHQLKDRESHPIDLSDLTEGVSTGSNSSESESIFDYHVLLRAKEPIASGTSGVTNPIWEITARVIDAQHGVVRARLPKNLVEYSGIYELSWAIIDSDGSPLLVNDGLLSVEQGLWPSKLSTVEDGLGPPSLREIRQTLIDCSAVDNTLLDRVEFSTEQILYAIIQPVVDFNTAPPPLKRTFTTRDFPFRNPWKDGILAQLFMAAAHNYRRNTLPYTAGGITIDDKNKEKEYLQIAQMLSQSYKDFILNKKVEINLRSLAGSVGSTFARRYGRFTA